MRRYQAIPGISYRIILIKDHAVYAYMEKIP